jgi:hypothetical protein
MSQVRDDEEAARQRIAALETALHDREAEVAAQRAALARKEAEIAHLKHERASAPDPYEAGASPYVVPTQPQYFPPQDEPSPYAPPGALSPYAPPGEPSPYAPQGPQGAFAPGMPPAPAPIHAALSLVFSGLSHVVSLFGLVLGFASCMGAGTSCDAAQAEGHATFIDSGWASLVTAILGIAFGAYTLRKVARLGAGYQRGVLGTVFGSTAVVASTVLFLLAALSSPEGSKNPTGEPWWTPKKLPEHWF